MKTTVKGHVTTWTIEETEKGFLVTPNKKDKTIYYQTFEQAKKAIRIAEERYVKVNPNAPIANSDIWVTHGILWINDIDGNYY